MSFKNLSKFSKQIEANTTNTKDFKKTLRRKLDAVSLNNKLTGTFFEDDGNGGLWTFGEAE